MLISLELIVWFKWGFQQNVYNIICDTSSLQQPSLNTAVLDLLCATEASEASYIYTPTVD